VSGATSGIGRAIARNLVLDGAFVVGNGRRAARLEELARELNVQDSPPGFVGVAGDIALQDTVDRLFRTCEESFGASPDVVVVNAGHGLPGSLLESDDTRWESLFQTNCLGALRHMRAAGRCLSAAAAAGGAEPVARDIVVIGSVVGRNVSPFNPVYGATKFAVNSAAEALRQELGRQNIRVSLIEPGIVRTEFQEVAGYDLAAFAQYEQEIGPFLTADDIARVVAFVLAQPPHVHLNDIVVRPTRQPYP
jgi:NADP-dependent 3-hydroxy acid dehydrogenase YdfG